MLFAVRNQQETHDSTFVFEGHDAMQAESYTETARSYALAHSMWARYLCGLAWAPQTWIPVHLLV